MSQEKQNNEKKPINRQKFNKIYFWVIFFLIASSITSYLIYSKNINKTSIKPITENITKVIDKKDEINEVQTTIEDKDFSQNLKIEDIEKEIELINTKLNNIKLNDELPNIILAFAELRSVIELEESHKTKLDEISTLAVKDTTLSIKLEKLEEALREKNYKISDIESEFRKSIDKLIIAKFKGKNDEKFVDKIKNSLPQLILVRRIDGKIVNDSDKIDLKILEIEGFINKKMYSRALDEILLMDTKYQRELQKVINMLSNQVKIEEISQEIFSYLKKIVSNV